MSFFPQALVSDSSFHPLFRLLDDFDSYSRGSSCHGVTGGRHHGSSLRTFTPRFDVKESADAYELHGELPGIDQKDVEIEFTDPQTITIKGRTERSHSTSNHDDAPQQLENAEAAAAPDSSSSHQPTVEDAPETGSEATTATAAATSSTDNQVAQSTTPAAGEVAPASRARYWVTERSVGEFARTFSFPANVDQEGVTARMRNGVLTIVVPKAKVVEGRRKIPVS